MTDIVAIIAFILACLLSICFLFGLFVYICMWAADEHRYKPPGPRSHL